MAERTAVLMSPEPPWPPHGGGRLRTLSMVEYLRQHYTLDLVLFHEPGAPRAETLVPKGLVRDVLVLELPRHSPTTAARLLRNTGRLLRGVVPLTDRFAGFEAKLRSWLGARHYDVGMVEHSWCAPYVDTLRPHVGRLVLDLHNVESRLLERAAARERAPARLVLAEFARRCREEEARWLPRFDLLLATSEDDRAACGGRALVVPNAIPWVEPFVAGHEDSMVFAGTFGYAPNEEGVRWFARHVWPELARERPGLRWRLVGRGSEAMVKQLGAPARVEATGEVDDALGWIARSRVAVAPVLTGSGTRVKIIEGWAAGAPVVATPLGAEGLNARDGDNILIEAEPGRFAAAIGHILDQPELAAQLAHAGRVTYENEYSWPAVWAVLQNAGL